MKKIYFIGALASFCIAGQASAQTVKIAPYQAPSTLSEDATGAVGENQIWYGYYKGNEPIAPFGVGFPMEQYVNNAIFVDGTDPVCKGKTIKGLRFKIQGAGDIDGISGWLSAELNVPVDEKLIASVPVDENTVIDGAWTEIMLPEPYKIPEEGVYAGYTVHSNGSTRESQYVGFTTNDRIAPDGALYNFETAFMSGWQWYGDRMGKLCYQVLIEGDFVENSLEASDFGNHYVVSGESADISVKFTNTGTSGVDNFTYAIVTDGVEGPETEVILDEHFGLFGASFTLPVAFPADENTAKAAKEIIIKKVNGKPNGASDMGKASGSLVTLAMAPARKALVETYSGTWCGWCPRAFVGIDKLKEMYGEKYIAIEAHVGMRDYYDPMTIAPYTELQDDSRGYPASVFSREYAGDPYAGLSREEVFAAPTAVDGILNGVAEASVSVNAKWANSDMTRILAATDVTFQYNTDDAHYAIAYVVKADGLSGEGPDWMQTNFFSYFADDREYAPGTELGDDFRFWLDQPDELVGGMIYNDVAVAAFGLAEGLPESISVPIVAGSTQSSEYYISVANNPLLTGKEKISVVAMLIDNETGRIVNADECKLDSGTGIQAVDGMDNNVVETARFNLLGQPVKAGTKGISIVVNSDGSTKKVITD